jgi:antitoxin HigA-1
MSKMHNPPHPGETLREDVLPALGLTVSEAAAQLGISRVTLSRVLHGRAGISVDLARRLELWLGGPDSGPSAESWLRGQMAYDLWQACQQGKPPAVKRAPKAA